MNESRWNQKFRSIAVYMTNNASTWRTRLRNEDEIESNCEGYHCQGMKNNYLAENVEYGKGPYKSINQSIQRQKKKRSLKSELKKMPNVQREKGENPNEFLEGCCRCNGNTVKSFVS